MLREFLSWWLKQLADCAPSLLRRRNPAASDALIARTDGRGSVELFARRRGQSALLGRFGLDYAASAAMRRAAEGHGGRPATILQAPPAMILEREVALPLAAAEDLRQVLGFEMDRLSPFTADEVYWSHVVERRDRATNRLFVRLAIAPKAALLPVVDALDRAGIPADSIETAPLPDGVPDGVPGRAATWRRIPLGRSAVRNGGWRRRATFGAAGVCAALAVAAAVVPFVLQASARSAVADRIAALRPQVAEAEALRRDVEARRASLDVVAAERARAGDPLAVLAAVTESLPDDTYLTSFRLHDGSVELDGQSAAAARLIGVLSADPALRNPTFAAPVTRVGNGHADQFFIRAELAH